MATISKTPSGTEKATIRKTGWPTTIKTFRLTRDAEDWARKAEDGMVQECLFNAPAERMAFEKAIERYIKEIALSKRPLIQYAEKMR